MRRMLLMANFLFIAFFCIAQQSIPSKIIGNIPAWNSPKLYQIQVGAYKTTEKTDDAYYKLIIDGMDPSKEKYLDFTRVMLKDIPANKVTEYLKKVKKTGFNEVIIREEPSETIIQGGTSISEKWEISSPDSVFASFEFNRDWNFVAVENGDGKRAVFGEYTIPQDDFIYLKDLGIVTVTGNNEAGVSFTYSPIDEAGKEMDLNAVKAEAIPESPVLDLFCRTWKVVDCTEKENIGLILFNSNAGTYFFTDPDGQSNSLSQWRWYDDKHEEFEYTHDNWEHYGRAQINELTLNSLKLVDPGYNNSVPGYSAAGLNNSWELVPIGN